MVWLQVQSATNLASGKRRSVLIFPVGRRKLRFLHYNESKLSLIAREIIRLPVNYVKLFHPRYGLKAFLLNKVAAKELKLLSWLQWIVFFFRSQETKDITDFEKYHQCSISIEVSLHLKVCFSLVAWKLNN